MISKFSLRDLKGRDDKPYSSLDEAPKYAPYRDGKGRLDVGMKPVEIPSRRDWEDVLFEIDKFWPYYMNKKQWLFEHYRNEVYQDINKKKMSNSHGILGMMNHLTVTDLEHDFGHSAKNPNWVDWDTKNPSYEPNYFEQVGREETETNIKYTYRNFFGGPLVSLEGFGRRKYGLKEMARFVQEDLCLLRRRADGWNLRAAAVCFPSYWSLKEKMGKPLNLIHDSVPQITSSINEVITYKMDALETNRPVERFNWTLTCDPELYQPNPRGPVPDFEDTKVGINVFVRVERQTLTKLRSGDILFTIRTYINSIRSIVQTRELAVGLHDAIVKSPMEVLVYRGIDVIGPKVLRYIDRIWNDQRTCPGTHVEYHR